MLKRAKWAEAQPWLLDMGIRREETPGVLICRHWRRLHLCPTCTQEAKTKREMWKVEQFWKRHRSTPGAITGYYADLDKKGK